MTTTPRRSRSGDPIAEEFVTAIKAGDADHLDQVLRLVPSLAVCAIDGPGRDGRSPLHLFADAPGRRPSAAAIVRLLVAAGADLVTPLPSRCGTARRRCIGPRATMTSLSSTPSSMLDRIERNGPSINRRSPLSSAVGYGQWRAARRLVERGAQVMPWHAAALGLVPHVVERMEANPPPTSEEVNG